MNKTTIHERGLSLSGLIFMLAIFGVCAVFGLKLVPAVMEYMAVKKAIVTAKSAGTTPKEIQSAFDKTAQVNDITSISGHDLEISKNGEDTVVSFAYEKKIPLVGPASLLLEYSGSTDESRKKQPTAQ